MGPTDSDFQGRSALRSSSAQAGAPDGAEAPDEVGAPDNGLSTRSASKGGLSSRASRSSLPTLRQPVLNGSTFASADAVRGGWAISAPPKGGQEVTESAAARQPVCIAPNDEYSEGCNPPVGKGNSVDQRTYSQAYGGAGARYKAMRKSCGDFRSFSSATSQNSCASFSDANPLPPNQSAGSTQRALLVGINYSKTRGARPLSGCVNDTRLVHKLLSEKFNFDDDGIWAMTDEPVDFGGPCVRQFNATKRNIMNGMRWLVNGANSGDSLFFHFSGHGSQVRDLDGDELDGWDEVILPSDYPTAGHILDDDIHKIMVRGLCKGARLTVLVDACSSGTIMDLPYVHGSLGGELGNALGVPEEKIRANAMKTTRNLGNHPISRKILNPILSHKKKRRKQDAEMVRMADALQKKAALNIKDNGQVISFSGCADYQRSADTHIRVRTTSYGAMTHAFACAIHSVELGSSQCTYRGLLDHMTATLKRGGHIQTPQLCSSHEIDLCSQFSL